MFKGILAALVLVGSSAFAADNHGTTHTAPAAGAPTEQTAPVPAEEGKMDKKAMKGKKAAKKSTTTTTTTEEKKEGQTH